MLSSLFTDYFLIHYSYIFFELFIDVLKILSKFKF